MTPRQSYYQQHFGTVPSSLALALLAAVGAAGCFVAKRMIHHFVDSAQAHEEEEKTSSMVEQPAEAHKAEPKTPFEVWLQEHNYKTTLEEQVGLAMRLYNETVREEEGSEHPEVDMLTVQEIIRALEQTPIHGTDSLVTWKGIRVSWFLDVFCESPHMKHLREFGCQLWFVRKVCIIELIRRSSSSSSSLSQREDNLDSSGSLCLSGPFVKHIDQVRHEWGQADQEAGQEMHQIVADADRFVSYTGGYTLEFLVQMIRQLPKDECMWMDIFCVDQFAWTGKGKSDEMKQFRTQFMDELDERIKGIHNTALILEQWTNVMSTLEQIWVLWEIFNTAESGANFTVLLPQAQADHFVTSCLENHDEFDSIRTSLAKINAENAFAENDGDRIVILDRMREQGLSKVNTIVVARMRGWLIGMGQAQLQKVRQQRKEQEDNSVNNKSHQTAFLNFLSNLARLYQDQGMLMKAEPLFREVLDSSRHHYDDRHTSTLRPINNLALSLKHQGKLHDAEQLYRDGMKLSQEEFGDDHPDTAMFTNNLGLLMQEVGKLEEAGMLLRKALTLYRKRLGDSHTTTLSNMNNLALLLHNEGQMEEAEELFNEALRGRQQVLGDHHPHTLDCMSSLAALLREQGRLKEAEPLYREAARFGEEQLGNQHPNTLHYRNNLASYLMDQPGKEEEAESLLREIVHECRQHLGDQHPLTLTCINNMANVLFKQERMEEAEAFFSEALVGFRTHGNQHPKTIIGINALAIVLEMQGKLEEAESLFREEMNYLREQLGDYHPDTLLSMFHLAILLRQQNKLEDAYALLRLALPGCQHTFGPSDHRTKMVLNNIVQLEHILRMQVYSNAGAGQQG